MPTDYEFHLEGDRRPLYGDVHNVPAIRAWARKNADNEVAMTGRLRSAFVYVLEAHSDHMPMAQHEDLGKEPLLAALFLELARREGVVRAFREGERFVEVEGRSRRAAVVLEWSVAEGRWWLAWRLFGTGEASVGVFHSDWQEREGATLDELEEPFREWLDAGTATTETRGQAVLENQDEDVRCATFPWSPLPPDAAGVGVQIAQAFFPEFLQRPLTFLILFACREGSLERWEIRGKVSFTIDDLARAIAAQAPTEAMAVLVPSVIEMGGVTRRCYRMLVERAGRMGEFVLPLEFKEGAVGGGQLKYRDAGAVPPGGQWIGVAPEREVHLKITGALDGREIPEA